MGPEAVTHGSGANLEYNLVLSRSDYPCSADYATAAYVDYRSKELALIESHLNAFVDQIQSMTGSSEELAALKQADSSWRSYRDSLCKLPLRRFQTGTINAPMSTEYQWALDRDYMKQLSGFYILSQF